MPFKKIRISIFFEIMFSFLLVGLCFRRSGRIGSSPSVSAGGPSIIILIHRSSSAVNGALNLLARAKRERENKVSIDKHGNGYHVTCHISGGKGDLMTITLYAPDLYQARVIKKNFHRNPEAVYQALMSLMTGNKDYLETVVREL